MIKFEDICTDGKCEACGKEEKIVVVASSMGPISNALCARCLSKNLEPYENIVAYISAAGKYPEDFDEKYVEYIRYLLREHNKTEDEFIVDLKR